LEESVAELYLAYHINRERLGRRRLALRTGLTEMAVRIELERLRDRKLVRLERSGAKLTPAGRRYFARFLEPIRSIGEIELTSLRVDEINLASHFASHETGSVWALRDAAVREGATGLLLLRFGVHGWAFAHNDEPIHLYNPEDALTIGTTFCGPLRGDLLLVASGPDLKQTGFGLWHAFLTVLAAGS